MIHKFAIPALLALVFPFLLCPAGLSSRNQSWICHNPMANTLWATRPFC
jgi:hypothetical protein